MHHCRVPPPDTVLIALLPCPRISKTLNDFRRNEAYDDELKEVMKVRSKALQQFGEKNIVPGMPMAMLEDALVPVYFYHRYQIEAATKLVGGMRDTPS